MLTLLQFTDHPGKMDISPFPAKVEAFLKLHKLPYQVKKCQVTEMPKRKVPVLKDGKEQIADSELILHYLSKKYSLDTDSHLTLEQRAYAQAIKKMVEEHLYFTVIYFRWQMDAGWEQTKKTFFGKAPFLIRTFVAPRVRAKMIRDLWGQGMGRHTPEEVLMFARQDFDALETLIGETGYVIGNQISTADLTCFPCLYVLMNTAIETPVKEELENRPNLVNYVKRLHEELWG